MCELNKLELSKLNLYLRPLLHCFLHFSMLGANSSLLGVLSCILFFCALRSIINSCLNGATAVLLLLRSMFDANSSLNGIQYNSFRCRVSSSSALNVRCKFLLERRSRYNWDRCGIFSSSTLHARHNFLPELRTWTIGVGVGADIILSIS